MSKSKLPLWPALMVLGLCFAASAQGQWGQPAPGQPPMAGQQGQGWQPNPGQPGQPGQPGMDPRAQRWQMAQMMGPGMGPGATAPAIAVAGDNLYIVLGNRVFRLDATTLEIKAQAELPLPTVDRGQRGRRAADGQPGDANQPPAPPQ